VVTRLLELQSVMPSKGAPNQRWPAILLLGQTSTLGGRRDRANDWLFGVDLKRGIVSCSGASASGLSNRSTEWPDGWCSKEPRRSTRSSEQVVGRETSRTSRLRSQTARSFDRGPGGWRLGEAELGDQSFGAGSRVRRAEKLETSVSACQVSVRATMR
jgi:hypothetical protein